MKQLIFCGGLAFCLLGCGDNQNASGADGHKMNTKDASRPDSGNSVSPVNGGTNSGGATTINSGSNNGGSNMGGNGTGTANGSDTASFDRMNNSTRRRDSAR